jgi:DnaJ family protein C protein 13
MQDHASSALIWNYKTREELREALENEIRSFTVDKVMIGILYYPISFAGCCT